MSGNSNAADQEFAEFEAAGEVEVGETNLASQEDDKGDDKPTKKAARRNPPKPAAKPAAKASADAGDDDGEDDDDAKPKPAKRGRAAAAEDEGDDNGADDDGEEGEEEEGEDGEEEEDDSKPKKSAKDHQIARLKREKAALARQLREGSNGDLARRLEALEKGLQPGNAGGNSATETPAPDPTDTDKYPLGHLDDRYIEDKLEWLAEKKAAERADAVLQRQQETEQTEAQKRAQTELLGKVDDLAERGSELFEDFQESVVEAGMRGDWDLSQATFEAAHEAENGAQILYDLSQDKKEASRVAKLSPYQQMKFVQERDAEIEKAKSGRRIPRAGKPPENTARGANSRTHINPATDNLDDFEKAWERDAKGKT